MPSSRHARRIRTAISPRFAMRILRNMLDLECSEILARTPRPKSVHLAGVSNCFRQPYADVAAYGKRGHSGGDGAQFALLCSLSLESSDLKSIAFDWVSESSAARTAPESAAL